MAARELGQVSLADALALTLLTAQLGRGIAGHWERNGAAQESNLPSVGLRRRTGFEDQLGHRPQPLRDGH
jgi:hypothetical protein